jgi:hypothetical protein
MTLAAMIPQAPKGVVMHFSDIVYVAILIVFFVLINIALARMGKRKSDRKERT